MALGKGILAGKKTYVTAGLGVIGFIAAYLTGEVNLVDAIQGVFTALLAVGLRNGITTETK